MDKDLYIEFLESEIRRISAGANQNYGQSIGCLDEIQDLKLENDRLKQREDLLLKAVKSIGCAYNTCHGCLYENGETCGSYAEYTRLCRHVLKELEEL